MADGSYYEQAEHWGSGATTDDRNRIRIDATLALVAPSSKLIADVGAGDGALASRAAAQLPATTVVSVERSTAAIAHAPAPRVQASIDALPFRNAAFDEVLCCEVVEHLPVGVYGQALDELARIASQHVVLTVPNAEDLRRGRRSCPACGCRFHASRHLRSFVPSSFDGLLGDRFAVRRIVEIGPAEPLFPRHLTALAHRAGLAAPTSHGGNPECPQCGHTFPKAPASAASTSSAGFRVRVRRLLRSRVPVPRRRPWLAALFGPA